LILLFISLLIFLHSFFPFLIKISKVLVNYKILYEEERKMIKSIIKKKTLLESLLVSLSFILSFSSLLLIHPLRLVNPIFSVSLYLMIILIIILFIAFQKKD
jgi:protein-S-isoprenylcysteine O-methyltransferase Ste14